MPPSASTLPSPTGCSSRATRSQVQAACTATCPDRRTRFEAGSPTKRESRGAEMNEPNEQRQVPAVVYAAKSTEDRHGSIPTQINDCRQMAARHGWEIVGEFSDEA